MNRLPLTLLAVFVWTIASTGCKNSAQKNNADTLRSDSSDSISVAISPETLATDSFACHVIACHVSHGSSISSSIYIDYPTGTDAFSQAVKEFIARQLKEIYFPRINCMDEERNKHPFYKGSIEQPQRMVDFYGKGVLKYLMDAQKEMMTEMEWDESQRPNMEYSLKVRKAAETPKYLTYSITYSSYTGGAHGSFTSYSRNISKITNRPIVQSVDTTRIKALQGILRKGIVQYFRDCGEKEATVSNITSFLLLPEENKGMIPLPVHTPYIENDSLYFVYQQYEIAPYAAGLVSFNVAYKDIKPYLTREAKALME